VVGSCKRVTETQSVVTYGFFWGVVVRLMAPIKMFNKQLIT